MTTGLLKEALTAAQDALQRCYDVTEWPADGTTPQDKALSLVTAALSSVEAKPVAFQGGMSNTELAAAFQENLPDVSPSAGELSAFALGVEVGMERAAPLASVEAQSSASVVPQVDAVMEQAQVFASAWSLIGGLFDSGDGFAHAEKMKADLRTMVEALAAAPQCPQPQAEPSPEVERKLRRLLAIRVAGAALYGDDGELQDNSVRPFIDFLRDSPDEISAKLMERSYAALSAEGSGGAQ